MELYHSQIIQQGGEGLILRRPESKYMQPNSFFKVVKVLDSQNGTGIHAIVVDSNECTLQCMEYDSFISYVFLSSSRRTYKCKVPAVGIPVGTIVILNRRYAYNRI